MPINEQRFITDFEQVSTIGATGDGGVHRPALTDADLEVRKWFTARLELDGFSPKMDGAGNISAVLASDNPDAKTLLIGSHLDSVPHGGRFDGALGVITALEVVRTLRDNDAKLPFHVEVISFSDEEGYNIGLMGSSAVAGKITQAALENPRGGREQLLAGMARLGLTDDSILGAKRDPATLAGYIEVHIEQGTRLSDAGVNIGVVTSIVGMRSAWLHFGGEAAHGGTMPLMHRKDALWGATAFVQRARNLIMSNYTPGVMTNGIISTQPGAFNIVPAEAHLSLEWRHGTDAEMDEMKDDLFGLAEEIADDFGLSLQIEPVGASSPATMDPRFIEAVEAAAGELNLSTTRLLSFALHDPQYLSEHIPTALYFVPSVNGISHNPAEFTKPEDCIHGANVMLHTILQLAKG